MTVTPIKRDGKLPCLDCLEPFQPEGKEKLCPNCTHREGVTQWLAVIRRSMEKNKAR